MGLRARILKPFPRKPFSPKALKEKVREIPDSVAAG
jgi:hypothetical protein